jgi:hypothetical protein
MSRTLAIAFGIGIAVVLIGITGVLYMQRGARVGLAGHFLKVRTAALDENSSVAVIDFRFENPSDVVFVVRDVACFMEENDGKQYEGKVAAEMDAQRLFEGLPLLGQKFNQTLMTKESIPPRSTADRMVAVRFEVPESRIQGRKRLLLRITDMSRQSSEISEK